MSRQEQELDAAEYVIGTLSGVERRVFEDLMATDKQTQEDVRYWERAFGALNASISPDAPPAEMWERIAGSLPARGASRRRPNVFRPRRVEEQKNVEPKQPVAPVAKIEPIAPPRPIVVEDVKKVEEVEPTKPNILPEKPPEPIAEPEEVVVVQEIVKPIPKDEPVSPEAKENSPPKEKIAPVAVVDKPVEVVEASAKDLTRKLRRWRFIALLALICLLALIWWIYDQKKTADIAQKEPVVTEQKAKQFLAVVNADGDQPSLVVQIDPTNGAMKIDPIGILIPEGKSLQLWYRPKVGDRVSVGLISGEMKDFRIAGVEPAGVLEITVEPAGGAPGNTPSGPVVYSGALQEVESK